MDQLQKKIKSVVAESGSGLPARTEKSLTPAAVLLAIVDRGEGPALIFTKRTMRVATHKGQISFPGGVIEEEDNGPSDAALREAFEEVGLLPGRVEVFGYLEGMPTVTDFFVVPVVGMVEGGPEYIPAADEVDEVFEVPLHVLASPANRQVGRRTYLGVTYDDYRFYANGRTIWGITGKILNSFISALES